MHKQLLSVFTASLCLLILILNPEPALTGATAGITQCMEVIVPSLFPFLFVTVYLNDRLLGLHIPGIHLLSRLLHIPDGGDSFLLLGFIGGYPVGAQAVANAYHQGLISKNCGEVLLGYCSNAGPAFLFGMVSSLFTYRRTIWVLWMIQLASILITGLLLPKPKQHAVQWRATKHITAVGALKKSMMSMASICGWVILFKILLNYILKFHSMISANHTLPLISGILELSNGCIGLTGVCNLSIRFILCAAFLSFGGICVLMQTDSVVGSLGLGFYLPGKIMQAAVNCLLAILTSCILFPKDSISPYRLLITAALCTISILIIRRSCKKVVENQRTIVYNGNTVH